jgi:thiol-disulfide isomerase/thioredoxin
MRRAFRGLAALVALAAVLFGQSGAAWAAGDFLTDVGAAAPPFSEPTAGGRFDTQTSGKPYVLELFAVWCPHCKAMVPVLNRLQAAYGDKLDIIAVPASPLSFDHQSPLTAADIPAYVRDNGVTFRIGFDGTFAVPSAYGLKQFPTIYFVGADRHVKVVEEGEVPYDELAFDAAEVLRAP